MSYKTLLLLMCIGVLVACSSTGALAPDQLSGFQVFDNGVGLNTTTSKSRRLKSFHLDASQNGRVDHRYELEYAKNGFVSALTIPATAGTIAEQLFSFSYHKGVLAQIMRKKNQIDYQVVDGKPIKKIWRDKDGKERTTMYEYNAAGNLTRVMGGFLDFADYCQSGTDSASEAQNLTLSYEDDQLVSVVSDSGDISTVYSYNSDNLLASRTTAFDCGNGEGISETFSYNENDQLSLYELVDDFVSELSARGLNTISKYEYDEIGKIVSIKRSRYRNNGLGLVRELNFIYDSNGELVKIQNVYDGIQGDVYTLTYEEGSCQEQAYSDPEYIASPKHAALFVNIFPSSLRCGFFLPSLDDS